MSVGTAVLDFCHAQFLPLSTSLLVAGRPYNSVSTIVLHCDYYCYYLPKKLISVRAH